LAVSLGIGCAGPSESTVRTVPVGGERPAPKAPATTGPAGAAAPAEANWVAVKTVAEFDRQVLKSATPVLVEFVLPHCVGCDHMAPTLKRLMTQYKSRVPFVKVDLSDVPALAQTYSIPGTPTILVFARGKAVDRLTGVKSERQLRSGIEKALAR